MGEEAFMSVVRIKIEKISNTSLFKSEPPNVILV
jgi:hypothetical protein